MKHLLPILLVGCFFSLNAQNNLSNRGTEFWVGYGHNTLYGNVNGGTNSQELVLYLGATQPATVTVSINGTTYSQTYNIAANSVIQTAAIPKTGADDARLTAEGRFTTGIHIVSDVPIVAYAHQYGLNSSGATMLMPVETYGYTYYSLNYTQSTNVTPAYSWFYVVASENNTKVEITPSVNTQGGMVAGTTYTQSLNKGEIYNVFGESATGSSTGLDVTGSKIKSVAGSDGKCHPIAVFSGSSRIIICGTSGDILQQQIFPSSAWGTNYLTYPTINTGNINQTNPNYYRIAVRDPTTKVKKNGVLMTGIINNFYYQYTSSTADFIEADKPVLVSQYVPSMQSCSSYSGLGDPEMFFLSPLQQAVTQASFYNTSNQNILDNYVSLIVKTTGLSSLLIDGSNTFSAVTTHPQKTDYSIVIQTLGSDQQHNITCDSAFTAITYGFGSVESYGYNAGTMVNNLDMIPAIKNVLSQGSSPSVYACPKSPFKISMKVAYKVTKMVWQFSKINNVTPGYDTTLINPVPIDSTIIDARKYYGYKLPNDYVISDTGTYVVPISITAPEIDNCNNTLDLFYKIKVVAVPKPSVFSSYTTCLKDTAFLITQGITGYFLQGVLWTFDDGTTSTFNNPKKVFTTTGPHLTTLRVVTSEGCIVDTSKSIVTNPNPTASFGVAPLPACEGSTLTFTDTSFFGGTLNRWYWDLGTGTGYNVFTTANQTATFNTPGTYTIKHLAQSTGSCASDTAKRLIQIFAKPKVKFGAVMGCLKDSTVRFSDSTTISDGQVLSYLWDFADPNATTSNPNTSTLKNPIHKYVASGTYTVKLTVTTANGCSSSFLMPVSVFPSPAVNFTINAPAQCLSGNNFVFTNTSTVSGTTLTYSWSFGDGGRSTLVSPSRSYTSAGTYNVKLVVNTGNGCKDSTIKPVTVHPKPLALFAINNSAQCLKGNSFAFTNNSTVSAGTFTSGWSFGDGGTSTVKNPVYTYTASGIDTVRLIVTSDKGCIDSAKKAVVINPMPVAAFTVNLPTQCQAGNSFVFTNGSTVSTGTISYNWTFGDGLSASTVSPSHSYSTPGTYTVKLIVTSNNGCKDSISRTITVLEKPVASFTPNNATQCLSGNNFVFTNTSTATAGSLTYSWTFGDGGTSTTLNPSRSYTTAGSYIVKLVVTTTNGCKDSISKTMIVSPQPTASFNINNPSQCLSGNTFTFTSNSSLSNGSMSYAWTFGDGGNGAGQIAVHSYGAAANYPVKLVVSSNAGCKDSVTKSVVINPKPKAAFSINDSAQCLTGNSFTFANASLPSSGGTLSYAWTFGDGNVSTLASPVKTYASAGTYVVRLIVTESNGCKDTLTRTVIVDPKPIAAFNISNATQCVGNNAFTFTNTSSVSSGTLTYQWLFGDGGTSTLQSPVYTYTSAGTYQVKLIVTTAKGCIDSISKSVTVNEKPAVAFNINSALQCLSGNSFTFTSTSTVSSGSMTYAWAYGDGQSGSGPSATHTYAAANSYVVKLTVTTNNGCIDSLKKTVVVNPKPVVIFTINNTPQCQNANNFVFTNTSSITTGTIAYQWSFGDGGTSGATSPSYTYTAIGNYTVRLIVTSDKGCTDSLSKPVSVVPKPTVGFNINNPNQCLKGNNFIFANTSSTTLGSLTYSWSYGDGTTGNATSPTHTYTLPGTYSVKLVTLAGIGCKDSVIKTVVVYPKPSVAFSINDSVQCFTNNAFVFTNSSTIVTGSQTYVWSFGDGNTASSINANYNYTTPATRAVKLVATSDKGCKDSVTKAIVVNPSPVADFSIVNAVQCLKGNSFVFTNNSTISAGTVSCQWSFGDGGVATTTNASHVYTTAGTFNVKLVVTSVNGCKDSMTKSVVVNPSPTADFSIANNKQCVNGNSFVFTNNSTVGSGTLTYQWSFGDGNTSSVQNPVKSYAIFGIYTVKLVVTSNNGCKDSILKTVTVYPKPSVAFSISNPSQCLGSNKFVFTNTSSVGSGFVTHLWYFGDGDTSTQVNPAHHYSAAGTYLVKLVVTSNNGCTDSLSQSVVVNPGPVASFNINNAGQCLNLNNFVFTNTSVLASGTMTHAWAFGDAVTSAIVSPSHVYASAALYNVTLIVTSDNGCKDTATKPVNVYPMPVAAFAVNDTNQCLGGNTFLFTNSSSAVVPASQLWLFGDGKTDTTRNTSHGYTAVGSYNVSLITTSANGCKDTAQRMVIVAPVPVAKFTVNDSLQCLRNNSFVFSNTSSVASGTMTYLWNFGDGVTSNSSNATHTYTAPGTYTVRLIVTAGACIDSLKRTVTVYPMPVAAFSINTAKQCLKNNQFTFTNGSTVPATATYDWNFGDGGTSSATNPVHSYTAIGIYNVRLIVTTNSGCVDTLIKQVIVNAQPAAAFAVNTVSQCLNGNNFVFTNNTALSSGTYTSAWTFGDATTSTLTNPAHTYATASSFSVNLIVTSDSGCVDSIRRTVVVNPQPTVSFTINTQNQCLNGNSYSFTNTSTATGSPVYSWSFGDGATANTLSPSHVYATAGLYTVKLIVTSGSGCKDSSSQQVRVYAKPTAQFIPSSLAQCLNGNSFTFGNLSTVTAGSFTSSWNFGDGVNVNGISPSHAYATSGTFPVKLVVTTNNGCKDSISKSVTVYPMPVAGFQINDSLQCLSGNAFAFSSLSTGASSYSWNFGDGGVASGQNVGHNYTTANTYPVKLVVTSINGCKDSVSTPVVVYPNPAVAFTINTVAQCLESNNYNFVNSSTVTSGTLTAAWSFGDGNSSNSFNATHSYAASGGYIVKLIVTTSDGCKDSLTKPVTINPAPTAAFSLNDTTQCLVGNRFAFVSNAVFTGTPTFQWDFGDGGTASIASPTHVYTSAGTFKVKLFVLSGSGCRDSITRNVYVYPKVTAAFNIAKADQCLQGNNFSFTNASTVATGTTTNGWTFGDGGNDTARNTTHQYIAAGNWRVKLQVTSSDGCTDTISKPIVVYPMPVAAFDVNNSAQCFKGNSFIFTNKSTGLSPASAWQFGDATSSTLQSPAHRYTSAGTYNVQLAVTSTQGCTDTIVKPVIVSPSPVAGFGIVANGQCVNGNSYTFNNASTLSTGTISNNWTFGDGVSSTDLNPSHSYNAAQAYTVRLIIISEKGCADTATQVVTVKPKPVIAFIVNKPAQCLTGNSFVFTSSSTGALPLTQTWSFGDTSIAIGSTATHSYSNVNTFNVQLKVSADGCVDSLSKSVTVNPMPSPGFAINSATQCEVGNSFSFSTTATISSGTLQYNWFFGDGSTLAIANPSHSYGGANTYTVMQVVTSDAGCIDSARQTVQVLVNPKARFTVNNPNQCFDGNQFTFTNSSIAPAGVSYRWQFGDATSSTDFEPVKSYPAAAPYKITLYLIAPSGCRSDTATGAVTVFAAPQVNAGPDLAVIRGNAVMLNAIVQNGLSFKWTPATYLSSDNVRTPLTAPQQNIGYRLTATGPNGCKASDSVYVKVLNPINVPNVFSPNGDGVNDTWIIRNLSDYAGCSVEVFNRYGVNVYRSTGYSKPWDGTWNGNNLPVGTYYYIIDPKSGLDKLTGNVTILR